MRALSLALCLMAFSAVSLAVDLDDSVIAMIGELALPPRPMDLPVAPEAPCLTVPHHADDDDTTSLGAMDEAQAPVESHAGPT